MNITFSIQGEFITKLARKKCHMEHDMDYAVQLLTGCLQSDALTDDEIHDMVINILDGRAEIRGTYPGDDYGYFTLDKPDPNWNLATTLAKQSNEIKDLKEQLRLAQDKLLYLCDNNYISDRAIRELQREFHEPATDMEPELNDTASAMLDSYLKRMKSDTSDDYGWLEPNGTFHPVDWGDHQKWADEYLQSHLSEDEYIDTTGLYPGDWLINHGWVLLHNPSQGIAIPTKNNAKRYTKSQQDFLYNYYIERNCHTEANAIYED